jgi:choline kinase
MEDDSGTDQVSRALVLAAGQGSRFGGTGVSKVLHPIHGVPLLAFTVDLMRAAAGEVAVAVPTGFAATIATALEPFGLKTTLVEVNQGIGVIPTIATAVETLGWTGPLVIASGDELYAPSCADPKQLLQPGIRDAFIAKGVYRDLHARPAANACYVEVDEDAIITSISEEPLQDCWRGTGLTYLSREAVEGLVIANTEHNVCTWIRTQLNRDLVVAALELKDSVNVNTRDDLTDADAHVLEFSLVDHFSDLAPVLSGTSNPAG